MYNSAGHVINGDLKIINNTSLREVFAKWPKYRELNSINWKHNLSIRMNSVEKYARQSVTHGKEDLYTISEWVKSVRSLIQIIIKKNSTCLWAHQSLKTQMFADKTLYSIVFVCKSHYIDGLIKELVIDNSLCYPTYIPTTLTKEEILDNHSTVLCSFGISTRDEELNLPSRYWIPKLQKCPFKQHYIAGWQTTNAPRNLFPNY
jgi:hypothetical protein